MWLYKIAQQPLAVTHLENVLVEFYKYRMNEYMTQCVYNLQEEYIGKMKKKKRISEQSVICEVDMKSDEGSLPV